MFLDKYFGYFFVGALCLPMMFACNPLASDPTTSPSFQLPSTGGSLGSFTLSQSSHYKAAVITWTSSANATSYTLKRGTMPGVYTTTLSTDATSPYMDLKLTNGTNYYYMVEAKTSSASRDADAEVMASPATQSASWTSLSLTNAPGEAVYSAAFANFGHKTIMWGGSSSSLLNVGRIYNSLTNTWTLTSTTNAPSARRSARAVWVGNKIYVWGGADAGGPVASGGIYNVDTDSWTTMATTGAPAAVEGFSMAWVRGRIVVWGGNPDGNSANTIGTGAIYNPETNTWSAMAIAPQPRSDHFVAVAHNKMVVSAGTDNNGAQQNGLMIYDITSNTWSNATTTGAPTDGDIWEVFSVGSKVLVTIANATSPNMWEYDPVANTWAALANPPNGYREFTYGNGSMVLYDFGTSPLTGGVYDYATNTWSVIPATSGLTTPGDSYPLQFYTGMGFLNYGGIATYNGPWLNQGAVFKP